MNDLISKQMAIEAIKQLEVPEQKQEDISLAVALARVRRSEFMPAHDKLIREETRISAIYETCNCILQNLKEFKPPYTKKVMRYVIKTAAQTMTEKRNEVVTNG